MNILIITPFYKQDRTIGSVRWTNIAPRLAKHHHVIVVTQPLDNDSNEMIITEEDGIRLIRCNQQSGYEKIAVKYFGGASGDDWQTKPGKKKSCPVGGESLCRKIKNWLFYNSLRKKARGYTNWICRNAIPAGMKIDVVINSACPFIEMLLGYEFKKRLHCKWICDFRDLPFVRDDSDDTHRARKLMAKMLPEADSITVVTRGMLADLRCFVPTVGHKITVITNGFSFADRKDHGCIRDEKLHVVYTGSLYTGARFDLFFRAVKNLQKKSGFRFVLDYAGGSGAPMMKSAQEYSLEQFAKDNGFLPREKALELQNNADCLLLLTSEYLNALPAKMFEYMLCEKPVICLTHGSEGNAEVTQVVNELNLGIAVEEVDGEAGLCRLENYLLEQWRRKCQGCDLAYEPNRQKIQRYDHDNLTKQFEEQCFQVIGCAK